MTISIDSLFDSAISYRNRSGLLAISFDEGETIVLPNGRVLGILPAWNETVESAEKIYCDASEKQLGYARTIVALAEAKAEAKNEEEEREYVSLGKRKEIARKAIRDFFSDWNAPSRLTIPGFENGLRIGRAANGTKGILFRKKGGYRTHVAPCSADEAIAVLVEKTMRLTYRKRSRSFDISPVS